MDMKLKRYVLGQEEGNGVSELQMNGVCGSSWLPTAPLARPCFVTRPFKWDALW